MRARASGGGRNKNVWIQINPGAFHLPAAPAGDYLGTVRHSEGEHPRVVPSSSGGYKCNRIV